MDAWYSFATARFLFVHICVVGITFKSNLTWELGSEVMPAVDIW
jgi:hypothetical protein